MTFVARVEDYVKKNFQGNLHHGYPHLNRVRNYAVFIAKKEGADTEIVEIAALLHDIAKIKAGKPLDGHAAKGARMAKKILAEMGMDSERIEKVCSCINAHSRREPPMPENLEEKCVYDADGLELVGAVGILRSALYAAYYDKNWSEMAAKVKTRFADDYYFFTKTGRKIAKKRISMVKKFYAELEKELSWKA